MKNSYEYKNRWLKYSLNKLWILYILVEPTIYTISSISLLFILALFKVSSTIVILGISIKLYIFESSYLWDDATNLDEISPQDRKILAKLFNRVLLIAEPSIRLKNWFYQNLWNQDLIYLIKFFKAHQSLDYAFIHWSWKFHDFITSPCWDIKFQMW
jgi:hypothetical protein